MKKYKWLGWLVVSFVVIAVLGLIGVVIEIRV